MVIDLGEGQTVDTAGTSFKGSVQARFWHAPEIQSLRSWSIASDIFAFAVAACTLLESRKDLCPEPPPADVLERAGVTSSDSNDAKHVLPLSIRKIVEQGLAREPRDRGKIRDHIRLLEDLGTHLNMELQPGDGGEDDEDEERNWAAGLPEGSSGNRDLEGGKETTEDTDAGVTGMADREKIVEWTTLDWWSVYNSLFEGDNVRLNGERGDILTGTSMIPET
jgi:hypothetical protein